MTKLHLTLISSHNAFAISTSKPLTLPSLSTSLKGAYSPSTPIRMDCCACDALAPRPRVSTNNAPRRVVICFFMVVSSVVSCPLCLMVGRHGGEDFPARNPGRQRIHSMCLARTQIGEPVFFHATENPGQCAGQHQIEDAGNQKRLEGIVSLGVYLSCDAGQVGQGHQTGHRGGMHQHDDFVAVGWQGAAQGGWKHDAAQ